MKSGKVRPIAICFIIHKEKILVQKGYDKKKNQTFYRPLGGKIKFGEFGSDTVKREFFEEINADINNIKYLGTLENIFTYNGLKGHEIVQVYKADMDNIELFMRSVIDGFESNGDPVEAIWVPIENITENAIKDRSRKTVPFYPNGIIEIIKNNL